MASTAQNSVNKKINLVLNFTGNASSATKAVQKFQTEYEQAFKKMGYDAELSLNKVQRAVTKTQRSMRGSGKEGILGSLFVGQSKGSALKEMDNYLLKNEAMRAKTAGLRHEVGRLRNSLLLVAFATRGVYMSMQRWFEVQKQTEAALVGLKAVAISTGIEFSTLKEQSFALEEKGFLSIRGSAAAQKNLAASQLSLAEINKVMQALTDASAFNRQGTLSMEEAIVGATQGIKNQNSIMIDNAGITKNVSVMYREYAAQIGKTAGKLTEMEKRQAIVNGIINEASLFAGNAEKSLQSYQGKLTQFETRILKLQRAMGERLGGVVIDSFGKLVDVFEQLGNNPKVLNLFDTLLKYLQHFIVLGTDVISIFTGFLGGGLNTIFDSFIAKYTILAGFLLSISNYLTNITKKTQSRSMGKLGDFFRTRTMSHDMDFSNVIKNPTIFSTEKTLAKNNNPYFSSKAREKTMGFFNKYINKAKEQLLIEKQIQQYEKDGILSLKLKEALQKRINDIYSQYEKKQISVQQRNVAMNAVAKEAQMLGFNVAVQQKTNKTTFGQNKTGILRVQDADQKMLPTQQLLYSGLPSEEVRAKAGMMGKAIIDLQRVSIPLKLTWTELSAVSKGLWGNMKIATKQIWSTALGLRSFSGATKLATIDLTKLKAQLAATGKAFIALGRTVATVFMTVMNYVSIILSTYFTLKLLYDIFTASSEDDKRILELVSNYKIEEKAIEGLIDKYSKLNNLLTHYEKTRGKVDFAGMLNLGTDKGSTLGKVNRDLEKQTKYLEELRIAYKTNLMSNDPNEEYLEDLQAKIDDTKTSINALFIETTKTMDKFNESLESTYTILGSLPDDLLGSFSGVFKNLDKYSERMLQLSGMFSVLSKIQVNDNLVLSTLGYTDTDKISMYQATALAVTKTYQKQKEKVIVDSEKRISEIMSQINDERVSAIEDSLYKQLVTIDNNYTKKIESLNQQKAGIQFDLSNVQLGEAIQRIDFLTKQQQSKVQLGYAVDEMIKTFNKLNEIDPIAADKVTKVFSDFGISFETISKGLDKLDNTQLDNLSKNLSSLLESVNKVYDTRDLNSLLRRSGAQTLGNSIKSISQASDKLGSSTQAINIQQNIADLLIPDSKAVREASRDTVSTLLVTFEKLASGLINLKEITNQDKEYGNLIKEQVGNLNNLMGMLSKAESNLEELRNKALNQFKDSVFNTRELDIDVNMLTKKMDSATALTGEYAKKIVESRLDLLTTQEKTSRELLRIAGTEGSELEKTLKSLGVDYQWFQDRLTEYYEKQKAFNDQKIINDATLDLLRLKRSLDLFSKAETNNALTALDEYQEMFGSLFDTIESGKQGINIFDNYSAKIQEFSNGYIKSLAALRNSNRDAFSFGSLLGTQFDIPISDLNSISDKYDQLRQMNNLLGADILDSNLPMDQKIGLIGQLKELDTVFEKLELAEKVTHIKEMAGALTSGAFNMGQSLGAFFADLNNQTAGFNDERLNMLAEQESIYKQGQITEATYLQRRAQINKYYSDQVDNIWKQTAMSVANSIVEMTAKVVQSMAEAKAAEAALSGGLLKGLGAALPFMGVALGLGALSGLLSNSGTEVKSPTFEADVNQESMGKFGGTIKAEQVDIVISPTFIIDGNQVFIGSGSVVEYIEEAQELMKQGIQQAIDNREINLDSIRSQI